MGKKVLTHFILAVLVLLCVSATYMNYRHNEKLARRELQEKVRWMRLQDAVSRHDISDIQVATSDKDTMALATLAQDGRRIGIYAHRAHCSDCWKVIAMNVRNICKAYHIAEPFIMADSFRPIDVRVMEREDSLEVPFYAILQDCEDSYIRQLSMEGKPFVFLLNPDGTVSSVMYYNDVIVPVMKEYFKTLSADSLHTGKVTITPSRIRLGKVPHRRDFNLHFSIKNDSAQSCKIRKVVPSCTCMQIGEVPGSVAPGKSADIHMVFTSDMLGAFERELEIYVDSREEPYVVTIEGYCQ